MQSNSAREQELRRRWADTLSRHGLSKRALLAGRICDDRIVTAAHAAGFAEHTIAEIVRIFNSEPDALPDPELIKTHEDRVNLYAERAANKQVLHHKDDKPLSELDDHHGLNAHGKPKARGWLDAEAEALDHAEREARASLEGWTLEKELREWRRRNREADDSEDGPVLRTAHNLRDLALAN